SSVPIPQKWIKASTWYSRETDGLQHEWNGRASLCPPATRGGVLPFVNKLQDEMAAGRTSEAIVLVNNGTEARWVQPLLAPADAVCLLEGRVRFLDTELRPTRAPLQGQLMVYFGRHRERFIEVFSSHGVII